MGRGGAAGKGSTGLRGKGTAGGRGKGTATLRGKQGNELGKMEAKERRNNKKENGNKKDHKDAPDSGLKGTFSKLQQSPFDPIVLLITLLGLYIRAIHLTDSGYYNDEAHEALLAEHFWNNISLTYMFSEGEFLHILITSLSFKLLGVSELAGRLPVLLFATATIYLVCRLGGQMFNDPKVGYLAGFLIAISAWHIKWSIILRPYGMLAFLSLLVMYFAFKAVTKERPIYYYLCAGALVLAFLTSRFSLALPIVLVGYYGLNGKFKDRHAALSLLVPALMLFAILFYMVYNGYLHEIYEEAEGAWWAHNNPSYYLTLLFDTLTIVAIISMGYAMYHLLKEHERVASAAVIFVMVYLVMLSFFFGSKQDRYLSIIIPFVYLLVAIGAVQFMGYVKLNMSPSRVIPVLVIFLLCAGDLAMFTPARPISNYRDNYEIEWREACDHVKDNWHSGDYLIATINDPVEFYFKAPDYSLDTNWDGASGVIWGAQINMSSTVWLIADQGRFYNSLQDWQQEWIWANMDLVWQTEHNYVFKSSRFQRIWQAPLDFVNSTLHPTDIVLTTHKSLCESYLHAKCYDDWNGNIDQYGITFTDAVWQSGLPLNTSVWFIAEKDTFNFDFQFWQRDWIWKNFDVAYENEYVYVFKSSRFDKVWKPALDHLKDQIWPGDVVLATDKGPIEAYLNITAYDDWDGAVDKYSVSFKDAMWYKGIPFGKTVWFIAEKDAFYNDLEFWQRDWLYRNFNIYWESQYTFVFTCVRFQRVYQGALDVLKENYNDTDVVLTSETWPVEGYLHIQSYEDWGGWVDKYGASFEDVVWHKNIPENVTVWYVMEKDHYYNSFGDWQRDWVDKNFDVYWEDGNTYLFVDRGK